MNLENYQMNFDFSRGFDFQKNMNDNFVNSISESFTKNSDIRKNSIFLKHFNFIITDLFFCWVESRNQFIAVSMSKRGYNSKSRYNPNCISSYCIKVINYMKENKLLDFYPGFYDAKKNRSRLSRIRPNQRLVNEFRTINLKSSHDIHHKKREYIYLYKNKKVQEYLDNFKTHELRDYNSVIQKNLFDIPKYNKDYFECTGKRFKNLSIINSVLNCYFFEDLSSKPTIGGCWWSKLDEGLLSKYKKDFSLNNNQTNYVDLLDFFPTFVSKKLDIKIKLSNSSLDDLTYSEKCHILFKYIKLRNKENFIKIFLREKTKYGFENYSNSELKKIIVSFLNSNKKIFEATNNALQINWVEFCSDIFINLIKISLNSNNPIYLVGDKIYFSSNHQKNIQLNLYKILEKKFKLSKFSIKINNCFSNNLEGNTFFGKFLKARNYYSERYIGNLKKYERKIIYGN